MDTQVGYSRLAVFETHRFAMLLTMRPTGSNSNGGFCYSVFERSGFRFASGKRVNAKTWSIFAIQGNAKML
jgi:hypothetical protein